MTVRQLFYQFVTRDWIKNNEADYKRLCRIVKNARYAGLIDWKHIVDMIRSLKSSSHWDTPGEIINDRIDEFHYDLWKNQNYRVEVWIEKDALVGVIEGLCLQLDVPYLSERGYISASEMWKASKRIGRWISYGYKFKLIHLGDHDPSGLNMSVDIEDRLREFLKIDGIAGENFEFERVALNYEQIQEYELFPNAIKKTDARAKEYLTSFGSKCWELDALHTEVINGTIQKSILKIRDNDKWRKAKNLENEYRNELRTIAEKLGA